MQSIRNEELQQRRKTRDAFLKAKFEEAAEKEDEIEHDVELMVHMRNDVNKSGNDESFVDSLLREYGI